MLLFQMFLIGVSMRWKFLHLLVCFELLRDNFVVKLIFGLLIIGLKPVQERGVVNKEKRTNYSTGQGWHNRVFPKSGFWVFQEKPDVFQSSKNRVFGFSYSALVFSVQ
jgi:hypothetical protein